MRTCLDFVCVCARPCVCACVCVRGGGTRSYVCTRMYLIVCARVSVYKRCDTESPMSAEIYPELDL